MYWISVAESVALRVRNARPFDEDPGGVHLLRMALLGMTYVPECPDEYKLQALQLATDYTRLHQTPAEYVEWNQVAIETHLLLAKLGRCEHEVARYYAAS